MKSGLKVIAPASVSNLACGFDALGMAIDVTSDEIIGRWTDNPGVHILEITGQKKEIPLSPEQNIAGITATGLLKYLGEEKRGLELRIHKNIQGGSGLGSSASSATAAAVLVNELLNRPLQKRELIPFALDGETHASGARHGDNVIPAMIGGLILVRDVEILDYSRVFTPPGLYMAILLPDFLLSTKKSRAILRPDVPLTDMKKQAANLGSFVIAMQLGDLELVSRSMQDLVAEPQRKHFIPHYDAVKKKALEMGALACNISGAGPAIFALCQEKMQASEIASAMKKIYDANKTECRIFSGGINHEGTVTM